MNGLHYACSNGNFNIVKKLLGLKMNINQLGGYYRTCIIYACIKDHTELVKYLLD